MADTLIIRPQLQLIASNITAESKPITIDDVRAFLASAGFIDLGGGRWTCEEISLGVLAAGEWTEGLPRPSGECWCGYDLRGNVSGVCPECGTKIFGEE